MTRRRIVIVLAALAVGLLALVAVRYDDIADAWIRSRIQQNSEYLLVLIQDSGDEWDVERLEALVGRDRAHELLGNLWFELLEEDHPAAWKDVVERLSGFVTAPCQAEGTVVIERLDDGGLRIDAFGQCGDSGRWPNSLPFISTPQEFPAGHSGGWTRLQQWLCTRGGEYAVVYESTARQSNQMEFTGCQAVPVDGLVSLGAFFYVSSTDRVPFADSIVLRVNLADRPIHVPIDAGAPRDSEPGG